MKHKAVLPLSFLLAAMSLLSCANSSSSHSFLGASNKEIIFNAEELSKCALSDYSFDGKEDSKQFAFKTKDNNR